MAPNPFLTPLVHGFFGAFLDLSSTPDLTLDALFGGRVKLLQPKGGHRAGTDAVLLALAAPERRAARFLDIGAGTGAVGLMAATRNPHWHGVLLESEEQLAALAARNIDLNGLEAQLTAQCCDLFAKPKLPDALQVDLILTNPPFFQAGFVRVSPDDAKAKAHVFLQPHHTLEGWVASALRYLASAGDFVMIVPPACLPRVMPVLSAKLGGLCLMPVQPKAGKSATRLLLRGIKGSKAPLTLAPPLIVHDDNGTFTPQAARWHAGEEPVPWPK